MSKNEENIISLEELEKMLDTLINGKSGRDYLKKKFEEIKKLILGSTTGDVQLKFFFEFIEKLKDIPDFAELYEDYSFWGKLYNQLEVPECEPIDLKKFFSIQERNKIEDYVRKLNTARFGKIQIDAVFTKILNSKKEEREEKAIVLQHVSQGKGFSFKGCGASSLVLQTGDQIVKLSLGKRKFEVPYHPRIMMPYFRKKYTDDSCLEVFNYANTESVDITDEKLLEIYKELEDAGILWGDACKRNLVVLTSDNNLPDFIASAEFNIFGFLEDERFPTNSHTALKAGDVVICDLDMLYAKGDPEYTLGDVDDVIDDYLFSKNDLNYAKYWSKVKDCIEIDDRGES